MMLGGAGVLLGVAAAPAQAAEVSYATDCVPPPVSGLPTVKGTTKVEVTAPATAKVGDEVEVVWKFTQAASKNPDLIDLPANSVQPSGTLKAAGAQAASIAMQGPRENPAIPKGGAMVLSDMKGKLKLTTAGDVTLTPDAYAINVMSTDTKCTPTETVKPAATIKVTAGEGTPPPDPTDPPDPTSPPPTSGEPAPTESETGGSDTGGTTGGGGETDFTGKEVKIPYACKTPIGDKNATSPVQINAKKDGGSYDLTVKFKGSVMDSPADIPADSVKPSMEVVARRRRQGHGPCRGADEPRGDQVRGSHGDLRHDRHVQAGRRRGVDALAGCADGEGARDDHDVYAGEVRGVVDARHVGAAGWRRRWEWLRRRNWYVGVR